MNFRKTVRERFPAVDAGRRSAAPKGRERVAKIAIPRGIQAAVPQYVPSLRPPEDRYGEQNLLWCEFCLPIEIESGSKEDIAIQLTEGWILGASPTVRTQ